MVHIEDLDRWIVGIGAATVAGLILLYVFLTTATVFHELKHVAECERSGWKVDGVDYRIVYIRGEGVGIQGHTNCSPIVHASEDEVCNFTARQQEIQRELSGCQTV